MKMHVKNVGIACTNALRLLMAAHGVIMRWHQLCSVMRYKCTVTCVCVWEYHSYLGISVSFFVSGFSTGA